MGRIIKQVLIVQQRGLILKSKINKMIWNGRVMSGIFSSMDTIRSNNPTALFQKMFCKSVLLPHICRSKSYEPLVKHLQ